MQNQQPAGTIGDVSLVCPICRSFHVEPRRWHEPLAGNRAGVAAYGCNECLSEFETPYFYTLTQDPSLGRMAPPEPEMEPAQLPISWYFGLRRPVSSWPIVGRFFKRKNS